MYSRADLSFLLSSEIVAVEVGALFGSELFGGLRASAVEVKRWGRHDGRAGSANSGGEDA